MLGSEFINQNLLLSGPTREANILKSILNYEIPPFLTSHFEIKVTDNTNTISYFCMPDYLSIGTDENFCRMPMNSITAQTIADQYDCTLPTRKMVYQIWEQSPIKLMPMPNGPPYDSTMELTQTYKKHNDIINLQLSDKTKFTLISGHKKDTILDNAALNTKNVCIYGWIGKTNGLPIQYVNAHSHINTYTDYSQCARLISNNIILNNQPARIQDVFKDKTLSNLISDGVLNFTSYLK